MVDQSFSQSLANLSDAVNKVCTVCVEVLLLFWWQYIDSFNAQLNWFSEVSFQVLQISCGESKYAIITNDNGTLQRCQLLRFGCSTQNVGISLP